MLSKEPDPLRRFRRRVWSGLQMRCVTPDLCDAPREGVLLFGVVRNESLRLPRFLEHYRQLGVTRFYIIENNSDDATADLLQQQPDVCIYRTGETFVRKEAWLDLLLRRHGRDRWCLVADADELLDYPQSAKTALPGLCRYLDAQGKTALHAVLLDLYPRGLVSSVDYKPGQDYFSGEWYFDPPSSLRRVARTFWRGTGLDYRFSGGSRLRVFGVDGCCSKFPLFRYDRGVFLHDGQHYIEGAHIAGMRAVLYHLKYLQDFVPRVQEESARGQHWNGAAEYKEYVRRLELQSGDISLHSQESILLMGLAQLEHLEIVCGPADYSTATTPD